MFDQIFDGFRKASESALQAQQDVLKKMMQQPLPSANLQGTPFSPEGAAALQKRLSEQVTTALSEHREMLDSAYKSGIQVIHQIFHLAEAKSPEELTRLLDQLRAKLAMEFKNQSEAQFRELQKYAMRCMEATQKANPS